MKLEIEDIKKILPHRGRQLMVDVVLELDRPYRCVGTKRVTDEDAIAPGENGTKVFPRSLLIEAMAQIGGIPAHRDDGVPAYIVALDSFTFEGNAVAGDTILIEGTLEWNRGKLFKAVVKASTDAGVIAEGRILYASESAMNGNGIGISPTPHSAPRTEGPVPVR